MMYQLKKHYLIIIFLTCFFLLFSYQLISRPLPFYDWDESIYAQVGREMVTSGRWYVPVWRGDVWLDKPPLVPLLYGIVMKATPQVAPEVSTRVFNLACAMLMFALLYILYYRATHSTLLGVLTVVISSFTPIMLQRALVLNIDIFLLIGWVGYILFFEQFYVSLAFLFIAVMSKSLIGFYAPGVILLFYSYLLFSKEIHGIAYQKVLRKILIHCAILSLWYVVMFAIYGRDFWIQHIYESHMRRVTASIETHFGQRTFYIDLLGEYFGYWVWISIIGFALIFWHWIKKRVSSTEYLYALYILPWFVFLNGTKTKIFWYSHPYIPQFAFLISYPLVLLNKNKFLYVVITSIAILYLLFVNIAGKKVWQLAYSDWTPSQKIAVFAREKCDALGVLMPASERDKIATLQKLGLTITTTTWWGDHPSMVYYFGRRVEFFYSVKEAEQYMKLNEMAHKRCIVVNQPENIGINRPQSFQFLKKIDTVYLFKTR